GYPLDEQQIGRQQRGARWVEHRQIAVGVGNRVRREQEETIAEVELAVIHDQTRRDDHRTRLALAENGLQAASIIFATLRQSIWQTSVAYEFRPILLERSRTEYVIGVDVREHHEADRELRHLANPCAQ